MDAYCDLIFDLLQSSSDKIIKNPQMLIADFRNPAAGLDILKNRISLAGYGQIVEDTVKLISMARLNGLSSNLQSATTNLARSLLNQAQQPKHLEPISKILQNLIVSLENKDAVS